MSKCEICNEKVAIHRCALCNIMTCSDHGKYVRDRLNVDRVWICDRCREKVRKRK